MFCPAGGVIERPAVDVKELVISADGHVDETDAFWERVPAALRERAGPFYEESPEGAFYTVLGQKALQPFEVFTGRTDEDRQREFRTDPSGGTDLPLRRANQAADGVDAEVVFPNDLLEMGSLHDPEMNFTLARIYNDWVLELFAPEPQRFLPVGLVPTDTIEGAVAEAERCLAAGFRSLMVPCANAWLPYDLPVYEPFWSLIEEAGVPLNFHVFTGNVSFSADFATVDRMTPEQFSERRAAAAEHTPEHRVERLSTSVLGMAAGMSPVVHLIGSGALERHPDLRFVITEAEAGWLAWILHAMDSMQDRRRLGLEKLPMKASAYFRRQGAVTFSDDPVAVRNIELTGTDCLMWGNDYPHDEGTYPGSEKFRAEIRARVNPDQAHAIFAGNAARVYGFDLEALARDAGAEFE
jgi:predicted TIM-barrel fold metal-dependent hydrolase